MGHRLMISFKKDNYYKENNIIVYYGSAGTTIFIGILIYRNGY